MPRATPASKASPTAPAADYPANLYIGTSGWAYPTWKPEFYPAGTPARAFLGYYASRLTSVEVNYTFRSLPTAKQLEGWIESVPATFRFAFKAPQRITHFQRLRESQDTVAEFLASLAPAKAAGKLGPLLFQLPPNFAADTDRLDAFLRLPALAAKSARIAFEFRHATWFSEATYSVLRRHNAALCIAESDDLATPDVSTADFHCYRLRRDGGYTPAELKAFAKKFTALAKDAEVYAYFKHEDEPTGALNATALLDAARKAGAR
ncbi:DUF72 domain-containing protein [Granulicella sp. 5B5]|uniref:DUF72 domain-containing protein n=1 Tax=Granulicella sp. 5B5 TaxID=1617967 RepID=UPI0015F74DDE|nr:DUF72 domain-containing protein [Granulicella sp. 5B5]QMV19707.1 DUF72 domain-containing protein [Granulicella sp. 5B5]